MPPTLFDIDRLDILFHPPKDASLDFAAFLQAVYDRRYCGSFTVHCDNGIPRVIEFPAPKLRLAE